MRAGPALEALCLLAAVGLFLALGLHQINLPGLYHDEALDAVPAVLLLQGQDDAIERLRGSGISIGGRYFPLMVMDYVGPLNTYLLVPIFALTGIGAAGIRLLTVVGGAITLILGYGATRALLGPGVAAGAILLAAVHPSFLFWSRQGVFVSSLMSVMSTGSLWLLYRWYARRQPRDLVLGALLLGLGLSAKLLFLWWVLALLAAFAAAEAFRWRRGERRGAGATRGRHLGLACLAFTLGSAPVVLFNLQTLGTVDVVLSNLLTTRYGVSNLDFAGNLRTMAIAFWGILQDGQFWYLGGGYTNPAYPFAFLLATGLVAVLAGFAPRLGPRRGAVVLLLWLMLAVLIQSSFTVSSLASAHLYIVYPWPQAILAAAPVLLLQVAGRVTRLLCIGGALVVGASLWWTDLSNVQRYHEVLGRTGGWATHSDAIYPLVDFLKERQPPGTYAMDWGIAGPLLVLSRGTLQPREIFGHTSQPDQRFLDEVHKASQVEGALYLFHSDDFAVYPRFAPWRTYIEEKLERQVDLVATFDQRDTRPVLQVYRIK
ncbi:MAG: glycosyltransferase family 39 protein [Chloroflexi bacterium]|nr:glycosyltransferase family 39 protein [Chloroflexota bacterium]